MMTTFSHLKCLVLSRLMILSSKQHQENNVGEWKQRQSISYFVYAFLLLMISSIYLSLSIHHSTATNITSESIHQFDSFSMRQDDDVVVVVVVRIIFYKVIREEKKEKPDVIALLY